MSLTEELKESGKVIYSAATSVCEDQLVYARNKDALLSMIRTSTLQKVFSKILEDFPDFEVTMNVSITSRSDIGPADTTVVFIARAEVFESFDSIRERYLPPVPAIVWAPSPPVSKLARVVDRIVKAITRRIK